MPDRRLDRPEERSPSPEALPDPRSFARGPSIGGIDGAKFLQEMAVIGNVNY